MSKKIKPAADGFNEILLYTTPNGNVKVEIYLQNETIWLTQQKIADLFRVQRPAITNHYLNEKELEALNNLAEQDLIFATGQAMQRIPMYMKD